MDGDKRQWRIGVDPGVKGGLSVISTTYPLQVYLCVSWAPTKRISPRAITPLLLDLVSPYISPFLPATVVIEDAHGWSEQSSSSSHKLALARATLQTYFTLKNCLVKFVMPRVWKRKLALPGEDKRPSITMANILLPKKIRFLKENDAAESLLIAWSPDFPDERPSFLS